MVVNSEDNLSVAITPNLGTRFVGQRVIHYPCLASTMDVARQEAQQGAREGTVIIADEQTSGRGRQKRVWLSPKGCLALSIILYPSLDFLPSLIMVASLAVVHSIEAVTGLRAVVKWPNDVLVNGRKVCGILIESEVKGSKVGYAIVGIGMNINLRLADFPELLPIATSLSDELGREVSRLDIMQHLLAEMERLYLAMAGGEPIYEEWQARLVTLGKRVQVMAKESAYSGIAESVGRDGSLLLRHPDGNITRLVAGEVTRHDYE